MINLNKVIQKLRAIADKLREVDDFYLKQKSFPNLVEIFLQGNKIYLEKYEIKFLITVIRKTNLDNHLSTAHIASLLCGLICYKEVFLDRKDSLSKIQFYIRNIKDIAPVQPNVFQLTIRLLKSAANLAISSHLYEEAKAELMNEINKLLYAIKKAEEAKGIDDVDSPEKKLKLSDTVNETSSTDQLSPSSYLSLVPEKNFPIKSECEVAAKSPYQNHVKYGPKSYSEENWSVRLRQRNRSCNSDFSNLLP
jgi:hypothetical protein